MNNIVNNSYRSTVEIQISEFNRVKLESTTLDMDNIIDEALKICLKFQSDDYNQ